MKRSLFASLSRLETPGIAKEVALSRVLRALTPRRAANAGLNVLSFFLSGILRRPVVWGLPTIINIEPTNLCNLRCPLCVTGSGRMQRPVGRIDFQLLKKMIDETAEHALYVTLYHQGEPYLHREFNEMVAYAKSKGLYVTTSSNAHFFSPPEAEAVVRSGLDSMIISLDGVTPESYRRYRVGGDLERVLQGMRNLTAAKRNLKRRTPFLFLQFLVMKHNEHEIPLVRQLAEELEVDRLLIKTVEVSSAEEAAEWLPEEERYRRYRFENGRLKVKQGTGLCPRPWLTTLLDWDGAVVPCCFDKNGKYAFGSLADGSSFVSIWKNDAYQAFRRRILLDRSDVDICRNCNYGIGLFK